MATLEQAQDKQNTASNRDAQTSKRSNDKVQKSSSSARYQKTRNQLDQLGNIARGFKR